MSTATASAPKTEHPTDSELTRIQDETFASSKAFRDDEAIARLAYTYWEDRLKNNIPGSAEEDWYRAEEELGF